jgi:hypothetical protein
MIEEHSHDIDGHVIISEPSPAETELEATEAVTDASVEIARIEAEKEITLAKIAAKELPNDLEAELAAAQAELATLRAIVSPPPPEVEESPAPIVVVDDSASEDQGGELESLPEPESTPVETERRPSHGMSRGWYG